MSNVIFWMNDIQLLHGSLGIAAFVWVKDCRQHLFYTFAKCFRYFYAPIRRRLDASVDGERAFYSGLVILNGFCFNGLRIWCFQLLTFIFL